MPSMLTSNTWRLTASPESSEKAVGAANAENAQIKAAILRPVDMNPLLFCCDFLSRRSVLTDHDGNLTD
jgi:hypothetical protein